MSLRDLSRPRGANFTKARQEALSILDRSQIKEPPVDPVAIARSLGLEVNFVEMTPEMNNVSGFYDADEHSINVNVSEYTLRQTFTLGHELGHAILHSDWAKSSDYKVLMRDQAETAKDHHEQEANAFAANLLVPRFMLDKYWQSASLEELSKLFAVSIPTIKHRLSREYGV